MINKIMDKIFPCARAMTEALQSNRASNERIRKACGDDKPFCEGYMTPMGFIQKAKFTEEHLNDRRKKT
jgi:hypothetical protein